MALKRYRYRAYPTGGQVRMLARTFGSCRVVFNDFVIERQRLYRAGLHKDVSFAETARLVTTLAKQTPERAWLGEVSAVPLQQAVDDASRAYRVAIGASTFFGDVNIVVPDKPANMDGDD